MALACEPRIRVTPGAARLAGQAITRIAAAAGVDSSGKWSAFEVVVFAPKQNLKTEMLIARIRPGHEQPHPFLESGTVRLPGE